MSVSHTKVFSLAEYKSALGGCYVLTEDMMPPVGSRLVDVEVFKGLAEQLQSKIVSMATLFVPLQGCPLSTGSCATSKYLDGLRQCLRDLLVCSVEKKRSFELKHEITYSGPEMTKPRLPILIEADQECTARVAQLQSFSRPYSKYRHEKEAEAAVDAEFAEDDSTCLIL
jgi:hypothetical protein